MKNKRGQVNIFISLMLGIVFFILGIALASPFAQVTSTASTQMNCSTATDYQTKANCTSTDMLLPLLVGTILGIGGFFIGGRFL